MILPKCHFQHMYVRVALLIVQNFDTYIKDGKAIGTLLQFKTGHAFYECTKYCGADKWNNRHQKHKSIVKTKLCSDAEKFLGLTKTDKFTSETYGYPKLCSPE